ncbi:MAG: hypothetical protein ACXV2E_00720 [Halobacteriota archaeon]
MTKPGFYNGKHYTEYIDDVKRLMREDRLDDAENLVIELVKAAEDEARQNRWPVTPWYYERLAVLYRKKKDRESEIEILERYAIQKHAPGPDKLMERLEKLKSQ